MSGHYGFPAEDHRPGTLASTTQVGGRAKQQLHFLAAKAREFVVYEPALSSIAIVPFAVLASAAQDRPCAAAGDRCCTARLRRRKVVVDSDRFDDVLGSLIEPVHFALSDSVADEGVLL